MKKAHNILVVKSEEKKSLDRPVFRFVNDIKMGFKERGCGVDSCGPKCGPVA
jgi:hypothetical protein